MWTAQSLKSVSCRLKICHPQKKPERKKCNLYLIFEESRSPFVVSGNLHHMLNDLECVILNFTFMGFGSMTVIYCLNQFHSFFQSTLPHSPGSSPNCLSFISIFFQLPFSPTSASWSKTGSTHLQTSCGFQACFSTW